MSCSGSGLSFMILQLSSNLATVLTPAQSGTTFYMSRGAAALTVALPSPTIAGIRYRFVNNADATAGTVVINSPGATFIGRVRVAAGTLAPIVLAGVATGTRWHATANTSIAAGMTMPYIIY